MYWRKIEGDRMYVIVGLGNPGRKYDKTKHNIGFHVVDYISKKHGIKVNKIKYKAIIGEGMIAGEKVMLVKPQTYMNLSGESVMRILDYYNLPLENLIVIYDDIDTDIGRLRIRKKGSAGSHNGMKNIIYLLKSQDFPRVRVGIGKPMQMILADYVMAPFPKSEREPVLDSISRAGESCEVIIRDGVDNAMNFYNGS